MKRQNPRNESQILGKNVACRGKLLETTGNNRLWNVWARSPLKTNTNGGTAKEVKGE